jgi:small nuclear ribonucleoprotein (snRNP)-like protein
MGKSIRIIVSDGRIIEGELSCLDKDFNFIVSNAVEYHNISEGRSQFVKFTLF